MITAEKRRFYCPEERKLHGNGNTYNLTVNNIIIQTLYYNELLNKVQLESKLEEALDKSHIRSHSDHINDLVDRGILYKVDHGRGRDVEYSLTEDAKKQVQLNLIGVPIDTSMLFRKIYQTILFNDISESLPIRVESEEDFDKIVLAELHVNKSKLRWARTATAENVDSADVIYPTRSMGKQQIFVRKYWKERKGESTILEEIEFVRFPFESKGNLDIVLRKIEYWQINRFSQNQKYHQEYICELPGFSIDEILASKRFKDNAVNFAFNALRDLKLIEPIMEFRGKTRFIFSDRKLHDCLIDIWAIHEAEFSYLVEKWKYFDEPTSKEKNRIITLMGKQEATGFFRQLDLARSQHNLDLRKFRTAEEYNKYIKKECSDYWEVLAVDAELDIYKEKKRGNTKLVTDKEQKDDLHKFVDFRKEKLYNNLKYLPSNYEYEGIEELKMDYKDMFEKYTFFQPVLKDICPKAFDASELNVKEQKNYLRNKSLLSRKRKIIKIPDLTDI